MLQTALQKFCTTANFLLFKKKTNVVLKVTVRRSEWEMKWAQETRDRGKRRERRAKELAKEEEEGKGKAGACSQKGKPQLLPLTQPQSGSAAAASR